MHAPWLSRSCLLALSLSLASCSEWAPPEPPKVATIPAHPSPFAKPKKKRAPVAFAPLRDRLLDEIIADDPSLGRSLGLHAYDGKVAPASRAAMEARIAWLHRSLVDLGDVDLGSLSPDERLDHELLRMRVELSLFQLEDLEFWRRRPQMYEDLFQVAVYLDRDYAPLADRAKSLLAHEEAALVEAQHIKANLASPLSKPVVQTAIKIYKGYVDYLRKDVPKRLKGVGDKAFQEKLARTNEALAKAAEDLTNHLEAELPKGDESHVLGRARYEKLLRVQEGLTVPLEELAQMGEDDLQKNKAAYEALLAKKVKPRRVDKASLFRDAQKLTEEARKFILDKGLVTMPAEEKAIVKETPPFMRWNSAFLDAPGAFEEKAKEAFYYITKPDPKWPKDEQLAYLPERGVLLSTTIHEVYPGHFLQRLWEKRAPTRVQKVLSSYSFVEGWAHYGEQMMIEEGFGKKSPDNHLGQLGDALLRNCRVVVSLGIHTQGMSLAKARERFEKDCHQDKATAREQAVRGTFDPGYFAYTLGKIQILHLREEAKRKLGKRFSLKRFHDALLSHGTPPVPLIRERVLADLEKP
jgi:uncharacterized protein (DUF885 family)